MRVLCLVFSLLSLFSSASVSAKLKILVTIKPIGLILQEIAGDKVLLEQLVPDHASHHDYPMRLSDHKRLRDADLVIWIGPELESFLSRPLANIPREKQITLSKIPNLEWPELKTGAHHSHNHNHDPHLWLNPQNTAKIASALAEHLSNLDKPNSNYYLENSQKFIGKVNLLDLDIQKQMQPLQNQGFAVYHQAYSHYVSRYHLRELGYLTLTPERKSGAKHLAALYASLTDEGKCIFAEPLMDKSKVEKIAQKHQLRVGYLDVMGIEATSYTQLMQSISKNFSACLSDRSR